MLKIETSQSSSYQEYAVIPCVNFSYGYSKSITYDFPKALSWFAFRTCLFCAFWTDFSERPETFGDAILAPAAIRDDAFRLGAPGRLCEISCCILMHYAAWRECRQDSDGGHGGAARRAA